MSNNNDLVLSINNATMQINRHLAALMLLFGTIGNTLNILVLNEQTLKNIPCTIYLCCSSISSIIFLWSALLTRVLQGYNINWPNQNQPLCKIRLFILNVTWAIATWTLVGASIDRFLCSSHIVKYRRLSTKRMAKYFLIGISLLFVLIFIEIFYCFEASVPNVPVACYGRNLSCRIYNDWMALLFDIVLPGIFLTIFGMLTIRNVRSRFIQPNMIRIPIRNNERNLTRMLLIQVVVVLVLDLPFGIYRSYASLSADVSKTSYRIAIENLIYALVILLVFFTHSTSFYLYTLTGTLYRAAFKLLTDDCGTTGCWPKDNSTKLYHHCITFRYRPEVTQAEIDSVTKAYLDVQDKAVKNGTKYVKIIGGRTISTEGVADNFRNGFILTFNSDNDRVYFKCCEQAHKDFGNFMGQYVTQTGYNVGFDFEEEIYN